MERKIYSAPYGNTNETNFVCLYERVGVGRSYTHRGIAPQGEAGYREWVGRRAGGDPYASEEKSHLTDFAVNGVSFAGNENEILVDPPTQVAVPARVAAWRPEVPPNPAAHGPGERFGWYADSARWPGRWEVTIEPIVKGTRIAATAIPSDGKWQNYGVPPDRTEQVDCASHLTLLSHQADLHYYRYQTDMGLKTQRKMLCSLRRAVLAKRLERTRLLGNCRRSNRR